MCWNDAMFIVYYPSVLDYCTKIYIISISYSSYFLLQTSTQLFLENSFSLTSLIRSIRTFSFVIAFTFDRFEYV